MIEGGGDWAGWKTVSRKRLQFILSNGDPSAAGNPQGSGGPETEEAITWPPGWDSSGLDSHGHCEMGMVMETLSHGLVTSWMCGMRERESVWLLVRGWHKQQRCLLNYPDLQRARSGGKTRTSDPNVLTLHHASGHVQTVAEDQPGLGMGRRAGLWSCRSKMILSLWRRTNMRGGRRSTTEWQLETSGLEEGPEKERA